MRDLAVIGDRRTCALVTTLGSIVWYCPDRFDSPSLFAALLDPQHGGSWSLNLPDATFTNRYYFEDSGVLETAIATANGELKVLDWMPIGEQTPQGICRRFSEAPTDFTVVLQPAPDYARRSPNVQFADDRSLANVVKVDGGGYLYASHPLTISKQTFQSVGLQVHFTIPQGETGWAVLLNQPLPLPTQQTVDDWLTSTLERWRLLARHGAYHGCYQDQVAASVRALRLLTFEETGGIVAAATTSLPEAIGAERNYDYRYVWLRDAGMVVSALIRAERDGLEARQFLDFVCGYDRCSSNNLPLAPVAAVDGKAVPNEVTLNLAGYCNSRPVRFGNRAKSQLQLDALGNVLLVGSLIYSHFETDEHWSIVEAVANYLAEHWREPDHGIWEEETKAQYTVGKVLAACGLMHIAEFARSDAQAQRWRSTEQDIRRFVAEQCLTSGGAYAAFAGSEAVDVSAALFPIWGYAAADAPEMVATMDVLEREYAIAHLYRRHLVEADSQQEGAFLAGTLWVAQYWVARGDLQRTRAILDAALVYANDVGLFAEEADPHTSQMLGNFPQTFVHAAFIDAVIDLNAALEKAK
ncbi:glycoside hydrolase family 15 protein [Myxacorys almedinensis A]|uniref:Glycoside hydrolase family 15 protein n=1 Tax=Myxacorys almedinensis A TaxID=2690445 RepID=A0A8J7Z8M0_9CYAN|nr:glycoside hydrolase family 15 protein [Myxacorys almedinensis A]